MSAKHLIVNIIHSVYYCVKSYNISIHIYTSLNPNL